MVETTAAPRYECSRCETRFTPEEYEALDRQETNPESDARTGYEKVCSECGHGVHTEKWSTHTTVDTDAGEFRVMSYGLVHGHGRNYDLFYEIMITHPWGDHIADRYESKDDAKAGHERFVERIREGRWRREPATYRLVLEDDDG